MTRCVRAARVTLEGLPIAPAPFQAELRWPMGGVRGLIFFGRCGRGAMPRRAACRSWSVRVPHSGTISRRQPACSLLLHGGSGLPECMQSAVHVRGVPYISVLCRTQGKKCLCDPVPRMRHICSALLLVLVDILAGAFIGALAGAFVGFVGNAVGAKVGALVGAFMGCW